MNLENAKILAGGSAKLSGSTGVSTMIMAYFQVNAAGIGALCTLITLFFYIYFQYLAQKKANQSYENKEKLKHQEEKLFAHIEETRSGFELLGNGLKEISNKIDKQGKE